MSISRASIQQMDPDIDQNAFTGRTLFGATKEANLAVGGVAVGAAILLIEFIVNSHLSTLNVKTKEINSQFCQFWFVLGKNQEKQSSWWISQKYSNAMEQVIQRRKTEIEFSWQIR